MKSQKRIRPLMGKEIVTIITAKELKGTLLESKLQTGGMAKTRYAKTNPRIVKFDGE